jgi:tetratricopeptide (TPR) repeat protein
VTKGTTDPVPYLLRGQAFNRKGSFDKAISDFNRALELRPGFADALLERGNIWLQRRDYDHVLADFDRAIQSDPNRIVIYASRASVYEAQGKRDLAIADLRRATGLEPKNAFETLAQASAKKRIDELAKRNPCGDAGRDCL